MFLPLARDLVRRADRAAALMRGLAAPDQVTLRMVAPETTVADVIAPFLAHLPSDAPMIDVREAVPARVHEEVLSGGADVGITSVPPPTTVAEPAARAFPGLGLRAARITAGHGVAPSPSRELAREPLAGAWL